MTVEELLFDVAEVLRVPVLVIALAALAVVVIEAGGLIAEIVRRRRRGIARLDGAVDGAAVALAAGDRETAMRTVGGLGYSADMTAALATVIELNGKAGSEERLAKHLAEYDYRLLRRLERTRILVRLGPAVGLMGTLIPLSPALAGLANGNVEQLTDNLRVAFSVTVAGLLVGVIAFAISLIRDRLYAQDYSDVEYVAAEIGRHATRVAEAA